MAQSAEDALRLALRELAKIAHTGPVESTAKGDAAVGLTLMRALGLQVTSMKKAYLHGIALTARRRVVRGIPNRVNLFAQVPDWTISECKSSKEIALRYGYPGAGKEAQRLNCTVRSGRPNAQGLQLFVDHQNRCLDEVSVQRGVPDLVARWRLSKLESRLQESRPASLWVTANTQVLKGTEYFQYRECIYVGPPRVAELPALIDSGTVTMDHLIDIVDGRGSEKGPLFKISPGNFGALFPAPQKFDLLEISPKD